VRDTIGALARQNIFIGYVFRAGRHRWLEYKWASALCRPLAGLLKFAAAVSKRKRNQVAACGGNF
jgi:hypothetical protein